MQYVLVGHETPKRLLTYVLASGVDSTVQLFVASALPVVRSTAASTAITAAACFFIAT
jgi:hypothetical protein